MTTSVGERSEFEYSEAQHNDRYPAINLHLQLSSKYSSNERNKNVPEPFKSRPKLSRTPPAADTTSSTTTAADGNGEYTQDTLETCPSSKLYSPSLSIEYPPGSLIRNSGKRKKFQFKKSHYQRFVGTSSAKKTKEIRKTMQRERSRSNSLISYQSSSMSFRADLLQTNDGHETMGGASNYAPKQQIVSQTAVASLPPSPPSDDLLTEMKHSSPNKRARHFKTSSKTMKIHRPTFDQSVNSDDVEISVSSSPSLIANADTQTSTCTATRATATSYRTNPGYAYRYKARQQWNQMMTDSQDTSQQQETIEMTSSSFRVNYSRKKNKHMRFGAKSPDIDTEQIRTRLNRYQERKGQNLEEIFRPTPTCWSCVLL